MGCDIHAFLEYQDEHNIWWGFATIHMLRYPVLFRLMGHTKHDLGDEFGNIDPFLPTTRIASKLIDVFNKEVKSLPGQHLSYEVKREMAFFCDGNGMV